MIKPIIFIATANDPNKSLKNLPLELKKIRAALEEAEKKELCEIITRSNVSISDIYDVFQDNRYQNRISIFHYAGHAKDWELILESNDKNSSPAHADGLVPFLARQVGLQLVFLNACSNEAQSRRLIDEGIPLVIGTAEAVADEVAQLLASRFYHGVGQGIHLKNAWQNAVDEVKTSKGSQPRGLYQRGQAQSQFPWLWLLKPGAEKIEKWNLAEAAQQPLAFLPDIPTTYKLPDEPYRGLRRFERKHAEIFFGRGNEIWNLYQSITSPNTPPIILFHGQSGAGKSSLLDAGLSPRLETSYNIRSVRRNRDTPLLESFQQLIDNTALDTIKASWKEIETQTNQPLLIILDQVEEIFTRPLADKPTELIDLLKAIHHIFDHPEHYPKGKIILAYRKEYHPEIRTAIQEQQLDYNEVFLQKLQKAGIIEAIVGVSQQPRLQEKYQLNIEENLALIIADDLEEDRTSAIAPILQILLFELWQQATAINNTAPKFTILDYQNLKKHGGIDKRLELFLLQKLEKLLQWNEEVVHSGLVLDFLFFHTTPRSTANQRSITEIFQRYEDKKEVIQALIEEFKANYLLSNTETKGKDESPNLVLIHDILAPLIREMYENSNKPGQLADKIFRNKIEIFVKTLEKKEADRKAKSVRKRLKSLLTKFEVDDIYKGKPGMRTWTQKEEEVVADSHKYIAYLKRVRLILSAVVAITSLLILIAGAWIYFNHQEAKSSTAINNGQQFLATNPTKGFAKIFEGWDMDQDNVLKTNIIYDAYQEHLFYKNILKEQHGLLRQAAFSTDGKYAATLVSKDWNVRLYELSTGELIQTLDGLNNVGTSLTFSPDNTFIVAGSADKSAIAWSINKPKPQRYIDISQDSSIVNAVAYSPDGKWLCLGHDDNFAEIWNTQTNQVLLRIGTPNRVTALTFSNDNQSIFAGFPDGSIVQYNLAGQQLAQSPPLYKSVQSLAFSPTTKQLLAAYDEAKVRIWDSQDSVLILKDSLVGHKAHVVSLAYSSDGKLILTGSEDYTARLWSSHTARPLRTLIGHQATVHSVGFSKDKNDVFTAAQDGIVKKWSLPYDVPWLTYQSEGFFPAAIPSVAFAADGERLFAGSANRRAYVWGTKTDKIQQTFKHQGKIYAVATHPTKAVGASGNQNGEILLWDLNGAEVTDSIVGHQSTINDLVFSDDGDWLLSVSDDTVAIIRQLSQQQNTLLKGHQSGIQAGAFSPDHRIVVTASLDSTIRIWSLPDGTLEETFPFGDVATELIFLPDGDEFVVATSKDTSYLWTTDGDHRFLVPEQVLAWSKNNHFFVSTLSNRCELYIRDVSGHLIRTWSVPTYDNALLPCRVTAAAISPDESFIISGNDNGRMHLWRNDRTNLKLFLEGDGKAVLEE